MADMIVEKLGEYADKFGEPVPLYQMPPMTDEELVMLIDECLFNGKPYICGTQVVNGGNSDGDKVY